jgi:hypothetical protein
MQTKSSELGINDKILFLKKSHLFRGLTDEHLESVAEVMEEVPYPADKVFIKQGTEGDFFYLIYSGSVNVSRLHKDKQEDLGMLVAGDFFGEEVISKKRIRSASITTLEDSIFMVFPRQKLEVLFTRIDTIKENIEASVESKRLIQVIKFDWLQPEERIYFLARKHPIQLWKAMAGPLLVLLASVFLFLMSISTASLIMLLLAWVSLVGDVAWGLWQWLDWGNDYYIVTNQRVVWLEKVIGLYDSRQEAPLKTILSVGVETDQIGRILDYGDVIVRTFVGRIRFHHVNHPNLAASLVEEHWVRSREISQKEDASAMNQAIRERLGLAERIPGEPPQAVPVVRFMNKPGVFTLLFSDLFKVRIEDSGTITYRKHWFNLLKTTFMPGVLFILIMGLFINRLFNLPKVAPSEVPGPVGMDTYLKILLLFLGIMFVWWVFKYIDWRNDIFQVTPDQIIDIDKTPLGREEHRAAPLENILSTEYKRIGFMQVLLNFGNVYITVGGAELVFEDVADPPSVQQDIDTRRIALITNKKDAETRAERDRLADWFAAYHNDAEAFRGEEAAAGLDGFNPIPKGDESDVQ